MARANPVDQLNDVGAFLTGLGEHLGSLADALHEENDEEVDDIIKGFPTKKEITKNLVLLGNLLENHIVKRGKRHAG